jgi:hypothetical protein
MRVSFSSLTTARFGREIVTDCPTLLAVPAIDKRVGLAAVEHLDLGGGGPVDDRAPEGRGLGGTSHGNGSKSGATHPARAPGDISSSRV